MPIVVDQMGRRVAAPPSPRRIVSLVPSQTELLFALGLGPQVVGRTRYCIHPADGVASVACVGGTKNIDRAHIDRLAPDLIIGNKEENDQAAIEALAEAYPVWLSDIADLDGALAMIRAVGDLTGRSAPAAALADAIAAAFDRLPRLTPTRRAAYLIWQRPTMVAGAGTFVDDLLARCGLENAFATPDRGRYPEVTAAELAAADLDLVLLSSEPFPFTERHRTAMRSLVPGPTVVLVDGEMFSWYGSRLLAAARYLADLVARLGSSRGD